MFKIEERKGQQNEYVQINDLYLTIVRRYTYLYITNSYQDKIKHFYTNARMTSQKLTRILEVILNLIQ